MIRPTMSHALNKDDLLELMSDYASHLEGQLAKANEREKRLEKILQRYESEQLQPLKLRVKELERESQEDLSIIESIANGLSEKPVSLCKGVMQGRKPFLNKFAIEQKIEGAKFYGEQVQKLGFNSVSKFTESVCEQLRKEQEDES